MINVKKLLEMKHSPVRNYVIPGLTSWLIGAPSERGCVRLFECEREHLEPVIPHSHRFDFQCWVLEGWVRNRIWCKDIFKHDKNDYFAISTHTTKSLGQYEKRVIARAPFSYQDTTYQADQWYSMTFDAIHSIWFGRNTRVLFFEGPQQTDTTTILEPVSDGQDVETFKVEPWMFQREGPCKS